ncbi:recombination protein RecU [Gracilibacillus boraciitolerans JCM 21714]|uniref:Holliday junction resolvase RecU n=1 Tax=Gracilibacillus boraciitolerans JCM 21714 TaxID=1298598 RepID=W4VDD7_9BACI|nr:Holliday junction resolvase RecU [Gracilibacillus boraciitolerans]GAE91405.1 recombination protein RecU [Gracilibacillus boraciitolerans JCM 21714]
MQYPNGKKSSSLTKRAHLNQTDYSNRGMSLEDDINDTNTYYMAHNLAIIHKKPTPVQIVHVDYPKRSAAVIKEAYFKQASTTDYNGVYKGNYIDFEAKETKSKHSFPFRNIHQHQIDHMKQVIFQKGICFLIIRFSMYQETYLFPADKLFYYWDQQIRNGKKSIRYETVKKQGYIIPVRYQAKVDYLTVIEQCYMENGGTTNGR